MAEFQSLRTTWGVSLSHLLRGPSSGHFSWPAGPLWLHDFKFNAFYHNLTITYFVPNRVNDIEPYLLCMGMKNETDRLALQISSNICKMFSPSIYTETKWGKSIQCLAIKCYTQTMGAALVFPIALRPAGNQHHIWSLFVSYVCWKISWSAWQYESRTIYFVHLCSFLKDLLQYDC